MGEQLLGDQTPAEFFKDQIQRALSHQNVHASDLTEYYLVTLLCRFLRIEEREKGQGGNESLAFQLANAVRAARQDQKRQKLQALGDTTLLTVGFFSDSLNRKSCDVDYFVSMGSYAYGTLSQDNNEVFSDVFEELASKFVAYTDVLEEVSARIFLTRNSDVLRLYDKFLRTGSEDAARKLSALGITPNRSIKMRVQ